MTSSVSGKKILLYYPPFFGYDKEIANKIRELGGTVDVFDPRLAK